MKKLLFICLFGLPLVQGYSQRQIPPTEKIQYFSVTSDLFECGIFQPNLGAEFRKNNVAYGLNFGLIYPDPSFERNILTTYQYKWPGAVYYGESIRLYCKYYYNPKRQPAYICLQAAFKNLWYNNTNFEDDNGDDEPVLRYTMDEKATTLGIDFLFGREWGRESAFHFDIFYGVGLHDRIRSFTVTNSNFPYGNSIMPLGSYSGYIYYVMPVVGIKIGCNFLRKIELVN